MANLEAIRIGIGLEGLAGHMFDRRIRHIPPAVWAFHGKEV